MTKKSGYWGFFTPYVWMFIQSYEKMRNYLYEQAKIETLIQFEYSAFEEATVPVCTFVFHNTSTVKKNGCYLRLADFRGRMEVQRQKMLAAIANHDCGFYYEQSTNNFSKIPGSPVVYWFKNFEIFNFQNLSSLLKSGGRIKTHDNNLYVRNWWEPCKNGNRWVPYANGGEYWKWYGDYLDVVDWFEKARKFYGSHGGLCKDIFWFKEGLTWGAITSGDNSYRIKPEQYMFSSASPTVFTNSFTCDMSVLAFLNTKVAKFISKIINPILNQNVNDTLRLPYCGFVETASDYALRSCEISKVDWDSFGTSCDFKHHPLLRNVSTIADAFDQWQADCNNRFNQLKANE